MSNNNPNIADVISKIRQLNKPVDATELEGVRVFYNSFPEHIRDSKEGVEAGLALAVEERNNEALVTLAAKALDNHYSRAFIQTKVIPRLRDQDIKALIPHARASLETENPADADKIINLLLEMYSIVAQYDSAIEFYDTLKSRGIPIDGKAKDLVMISAIQVARLDVAREVATPKASDNDLRHHIRFAKMLAAFGEKDEVIAIVDNVYDRINVGMSNETLSKNQIKNALFGLRAFAEVGVRFDRYTECCKEFTARTAEDKSEMVRSGPLNVLLLAAPYKKFEDLTRLMRAEPTYLDSPNGAAILDR